MVKKVAFLFIFLMLFSFAFAQETQGGEYSKQGAQYMDNGIIVNTLMYDEIKLNEPITVYMTPYQQSGKTLDNSTTDCRLGITNPDGSRLLLLEQANFTVISNDDIWTAIIPGSFLNETGRYLYNWDCQQTVNGGYFNGAFLVGAEGQELTEGYAILYMTSIIIMLILAIGLIFATKLLPEDRKDDNDILQISNLKHLKLVFYGFAYTLFMAVLFIASNVTLAYFMSPMVGDLLFVLFRLMFYGLMIMLPLGIIKIFVDIFKDKEFKKMIERGIDVSTP